MADLDGDGVPDALEGLNRVVLMEASRVAEALLRARQKALEERVSEERAVAREASRRVAAEAAFSRAKLAPVMDERWWEKASPEAAARKWSEAKAWDGVDESFTPYRERIESEVLERWGLPVEELAREKLEVRGVPGREPMSVEEARAVAAESAPAWYKVHESLEQEMTELARTNETARLVDDMSRLRDTGRLDTDSARDEWSRFFRGDEPFRDRRSGESVGEYLAARREETNELWERTAAARESIGPVPVDLRDLGDGEGREAGAGGRPGGVPVVTAPMPVLSEEDVRRDREDRDRVESAERSAGWDDPGRRSSREAELASREDVSPDLRAGAMAVDWATAKPGGRVSVGKSGGPRRSARSRSREMGQEQGPELGR